MLDKGRPVFRRPAHPGYELFERVHLSAVLPVLPASLAASTCGESGAVVLIHAAHVLLVCVCFYFSASFSAEAHVQFCEL